MALYLGTDKVSVGNAYNIDTLLDRAVYVGSPEEPIEEQSLVADKLAIPRKIGNAEFDGSSDISGSEIGIPNYNILDNTDFANVVNQRGRTSYSSPGYCIDRWQILNALYDVESHTITLNPATTSFASAYLSQYVRVSALPAADVPLTVSASINGTVFSATGKRSDASFGTLRGKIFADVSVSDYCELIMGVSTAEDKIFINIENKEGSATSESLIVDWMKLEVGNIATPWQPKGYGVELVECQRYYLRVNAWQLLGMGYVNYDGTFFVIMMPTPSTMRIDPTINNLTGTAYFEDGTTKTYTGTPTAVARSGWIAITFKGTFTGHGGKPVNFITSETATEISADL